MSLTGIACLIIGVAYALSIKPEPVEKSFHLGNRWPPLSSLTGIACLIIGVAYAVIIRPQPVE